MRKLHYVINEQPLRFSIPKTCPRHINFIDWTSKNADSNRSKVVLHLNLFKCNNAASLSQEATVAIQEATCWNMVFENTAVGLGNEKYRIN